MKSLLWVKQVTVDGRNWVESRPHCGGPVSTCSWRASISSGDWAILGAGCDPRLYNKSVVDRSRLSSMSDSVSETFFTVMLSWLSLSEPAKRLADKSVYRINYFGLSRRTSNPIASSHRPSRRNSGKLSRVTSASGGVNRVLLFWMCSDSRGLSPIQFTPPDVTRTSTVELCRGRAVWIDQSVHQSVG